MPPPFAGVTSYLGNHRADHWEEEIKTVSTADRVSEKKIWGAPSWGSSWKDHLSICIQNARKKNVVCRSWQWWNAYNTFKNKNCAATCHYTWPGVGQDAVLNFALEVQIQATVGHRCSILWRDPKKMRSYVIFLGDLPHIQRMEESSPQRNFRLQNNFYFDDMICEVCKQALEWQCPMTFRQLRIKGKQHVNCWQQRLPLVLPRGQSCLIHYVRRSVVKTRIKVSYQEHYDRKKEYSGRSPSYQAVKQVEMELCQSV